MFVQRWKAVMALAVTVAIAGCGGGGNTVPVQGRVTYDGQPVANMVVKFLPAEGRPSEAATNEDGTFDMWYTMDEMGVERDTHSVTVYWTPATDDGTSKPSEMERNVLADFEQNGPIEVVIDKPQTNFEIKLPR